MDNVIHAETQTVNWTAVTHVEWWTNAVGLPAATVCTFGGKFVLAGDEAEKLAEKLGWHACVKAREAARAKAEKDAEAEAEKEAKAAEKAARAAEAAEHPHAKKH